MQLLQLDGWKTFNYKTMATQRQDTRSTSEGLRALETVIINMAKKIAPYRLVSSGVFTVTSAGVQLQLTGTSTPCRKIVFQCLTGNKGDMYVGLTDVSATTANITVDHGTLAVETFEIEDANRVWIDAANDGDKISYFIYA